MGRKGFIWLTLLHHNPIIEGSQGRNLKAGVDAEAIEGVLLTGLLFMISSACFLIEPIHDHQPRDGASHNGLNPALSINHKLRKCVTVGGFEGVLSWLRRCGLRVVCVKLP